VRLGTFAMTRSSTCRHRAEPSTARIRVLETPFAAVDDLRCVNSDRTQGPQGFSPDFQVCLPYRGLFVWHVGQDDVVGEANQVLFVSGGEAFRVSQPARGGYGELIVTPTLELLSELGHVSDSRLSTHPLFLRRRRSANLTLQNLRARFLHCIRHGNRDAFAAEEVLLDVLRCAFEPQTSHPRPAGATRRLVERTKAVLEANACCWLRLADVARTVGASPAYLTDVFRRVEGIPVHKYLVQLRLAKALIELPHSNDLTQLALDLGFSSHSHFAAVFRQAFDCTPSAFRELTCDRQVEHGPRPRL
jgi:AraC family transcriptional regulator